MDNWTLSDVPLPIKCPRSLLGTSLYTNMSNMYVSIPHPDYVLHNYIIALKLPSFYII